MAYVAHKDFLLHMTASELAVLSGDPTGTTVDYDRVDVAVYKAGSNIDTVLQRLYKTPLDTHTATPPTIHSACMAMAIYNLHEDYSPFGEVPGPIVWSKVNAWSIIKKIGAGEMELDGPPENTILVKKPYPDIVTAKPEGRTISNETLNQWYERQE